MTSESVEPPGTAAAEPPAYQQSKVWLVARITAVGSVIALLVLLIFGLARSGDGGRFVSQIAHDKKPVAPPFNLAVIWPNAEPWPANLRPRLNDRRLTLSELRGQPTVINFWASWCVPCKEEAPAFAATAERFRGRVAFVGLNVQDLTGPARHFLERYKVNYVSIRDGGNKTYTDYGLTGVPETYYIDPRGHAIAHAIGAVTKTELAASIQSLLKAPQ